MSPFRWTARHGRSVKVPYILDGRHEAPFYPGSMVDLTDAPMLHAVGTLVRVLSDPAIPREVVRHRARVVRGESAVRTAA